MNKLLSILVNVCVRWQKQLAEDEYLDLKQSAHVKVVLLCHTINLVWLTCAFELCTIFQSMMNAPLLDRWQIVIGGARKKVGHFHKKTFGEF